MKNQIAFAFKMLLAVSTVVILFSCGELSPRGAQVKIADPGQLLLLKNCTALGMVKGTSEIGFSSALVDLKNRAGDWGANIVVSRLQEEKTVGAFGDEWYLQGQAMICPASVSDQIISADTF